MTCKNLSLSSSYWLATYTDAAAYLRHAQRSLSLQELKVKCRLLLTHIIHGVVVVAEGVMDAIMDWLGC